MFALGLASALVASALFNIGVALQAVESKKTPKSLGLRLGLLTRLLQRPLWLLGLALGIVGVGPQVLAFAWAPFAVAQPALTVGLLLLLVIGRRRLHENVGPVTWVGVVGIVAGVAVLAVGVPARVEAHRGWLPVVSVAVLLAIPSLLPFAVRGTRLDTAWSAIVATGTGFAATNVATKLMSDDAGLGNYPNAAAWALVALAMGVAATITNMTAFQRRPATIVVPVTTAIQTFLPIVLEPFFLRERWASAPLDGAPIAIGIMLAALGTVFVARARPVAELAAGAAS
jgi:drug/metabolite transporter (DMT)-like permease